MEQPETTTPEAVAAAGRRLPSIATAIPRPAIACAAVGAAAGLCGLVLMAAAGLRQQHQADSLKGAFATMDADRGRHAELLEEIGRYQERLLTVRQELTAAEERRKEMDAALAGEQSQAEAIKRNGQRLQEQQAVLARMAEEAAATAARKATLEAQLAPLAEQLEKSQTLNDRLAAEIAAGKAQLERLRVDVAEARIGKQDQVNAEASVRAAALAYERYGASIRDLEQRKLVLEAENKTLSDKQVKLKTDVLDAEQQVEAMLRYLKAGGGK